MNLRTATSQDLARLQIDAAAVFGPILLKEALTRLCRIGGEESLKRFKQSMLDRIEATADDHADMDVLREFAVVWYNGIHPAKGCQ